MLRSLLIGLVAGARSMTPLAAVTDAASRGALPRDNGAPAWLGHPGVAAGAKLLAAGELWGDKLKTAPDRIVPLGIAARLVTAGLSGAALAPRKRALAGALIAATAATAAAFLTFHLRMGALRRFGQTPSGVVEDALALGAAAIVTGARRR